MLTTSRIPLIDLGGHIDPDRAAARETARQLYDALSTIGFAYITGHTVSPTVREAAFDASRAFHMSSPTQKQSLAINGFHRGYVGLATSTIVTSSVAKVTRPNMSGTDRSGARELSALPQAVVGTVDCRAAGAVHRLGRTHPPFRPRRP